MPGQFHEQDHDLEVLLTKELPHPVLLGCNAPAFITLVLLAIQKRRLALRYGQVKPCWIPQ